MTESNNTVAPADGNLPEIRRRLEEAEETLRAIRSGEVDALVVQGVCGDQVFTLQGADHAYRMLIESMQQGAATLSDDGTVLYCNRSFADIFGLPHEKVIGSTVGSFLVASQQPVFAEMLRLSHFHSSAGELLIDAPNDQRRSVYVAINALTLMDVSTLCLIVTDLTEQKKHQDLQDTNRRKDEFLAMLAHELRNPLAPILNAVAIVKHLSIENEKLAYASEIIERQTRHLARLVDDLLDVSRISLGKVKLQTEKVELGAIISRAVEISRPLIDARKQHLTLRLPPKGVILEGDPTRLAQVISNLLTNAAKYTEEGGAVFLFTELDGPFVVIRVRDTGIGIPTDLLPRVFDLFIQGDCSLARSEGGLGIGLTLVRRLVELHGGTVKAISDGPGRGSEFVVRLPALSDEVRASDRKSVLMTPVAGRGGRRILVVDDNKDAADILSMLLRMGGHDVTVANTGSEAFEVAKSARFEAVLLDIGLPGMNGYEVAQRLRKLAGYEATMLVAMTGYGQEEDRQRSRDAGFHHHFVKPVELDALNALLTSNHGGAWSV